MSSATSRSIKNVLNELEFLRDEKVISGDQFDQVKRMLDGASSNGGKQAESAPQNSGSSNGNSSGSREVFVSRYDFNGQQSSDLSLHNGEKVELIEKLNNDWWRGKSLASGREGVFPSNYVVPFDGHNEKQEYSQNSGPDNRGNNPPNYYQGNNNGGNNGGNNYGPPPPQQFYGQQQMYQPPGPQPQFYPAQQQQQPQQQPQQQQQPEGQHHGFGDAAMRFGKKFGNAAVWGAGATFGSDIINDIMR